MSGAFNPLLRQYLFRPACPFELYKRGLELILNKGQWFGKGSLLVEGASIGDDVQLDLEISEDESGMTLSGTLLGDFVGEVSIRVAPDEVGTYIIDARVAAVALDGIAKLESEPNLALLWNEGHTQNVTVALFNTDNGIGCRGFWHEGGKTRTWEILFRLKQHVVSGSNVVSFSPRRRR